MNRKIILLVFGMFMLPVVVAILLNSRWIDWAPGETRNFGDLVAPVIPLPSGPWTGSDDQTIEREALLDLWQLAHVRRSPCDEACMEDLYWLRQVRQAQDRHVPEVGLLLISETSIGDEQRARIRQLTEAFTIIDGPESSALIDSFPGDDVDGQRFIVDPGGNIMMAYTTEADPNDIRRDLGRLLTWTQRD